MSKRITSLVVLIATVLMIGIVPTLGQDATEVVFACYQDGSECEVLENLIEDFEAENPDIDVVINDMGYTAIDEQLPIQVEAGQGPDIARVTNFAIYKDFYLDLTEFLSEETVDYWTANFPAPILEAMSPDGMGGGLSGFPDQFSVTGPYVNLTLFEQAGVDLPDFDTATWEDWTAATAEVSAALSDNDFTVYAIAIDRTGHRFAGPAMTMGATLFDEDGMFSVDSEGFRMMAELLNRWHEEELIPADVWLGAGDSYAAANGYFVNGQVVMYMAGSWWTGAFGRDIADDFDWAVVPNPQGPGGSTGIAGGTGIVALDRGAGNGEAVARVMEYLIQADVYTEYSARTVTLPAHAEVASMGVDFDTDSDAVSAALGVYASEIPKLSDQAVLLNVHPFAFAYYRNSADRLTQYLIGELTLDEALEALQEDIDDAVAEASS